jgi:hypothetical protein
MKNYDLKVVCKSTSCKGDCKILSGITKDVYAENKFLFENRFKASCNGGDSERDVIGRVHEVDGGKVVEYVWPKTQNEACKYGLVVTGEREDEIMETMQKKLEELTSDFRE